MSNVVTRNVATSADEAAKVVPRAEFRVFGLGIIDTVKANMWNGRTVLYQARRMPAETYILSRRTSDANVKVRDGLLDIKVKTGETPEGYEVFQPRGKFQFPVQREELEAIAAQLRVVLPIDGDRCTFDGFLSLVRQHGDLVAVTVEKMRYGFTIDGVICEYAQVYFNGALVESACVESERYDAMRTVIEGLGIAAHPNVNYLKAAKRVVGLE